MKPGMDAFKKGDAYFTADDEPASISDWQGDNGTLSADIAQLASDGLERQGPRRRDGPAGGPGGRAITTTSKPQRRTRTRSLRASRSPGPGTLSLSRR